MRYRILALAAISWIAMCLGPYVYALNDLITRDSSFRELVTP